MAMLNGLNGSVKGEEVGEAHWRMVGVGAAGAAGLGKMVVVEVGSREAVEAVEFRKKVGAAGGRHSLRANET